MSCAQVLGSSPPLHFCTMHTCKLSNRLTGLGENTQVISQNTQMLRLLCHVTIALSSLLPSPLHTALCSCYILNAEEFHYLLFLEFCRFMFFLLSTGPTTHVCLLFIRIIPSVYFPNLNSDTLDKIINEIAISVCVRGKLRGLCQAKRTFSLPRKLGLAKALCF